MIVTKIDEVYQVHMPASVHQMLSIFSVGVSFGLGSTNNILTCVGIRGFYWRLVFWMVAPAGVVLGTAIASASRLAFKGTLSRSSFMSATLPLITRLLFLLYPLVTNVAFEAFSCYKYASHMSCFSTHLHLHSRM